MEMFFSSVSYTLGEYLSLRYQTVLGVWWRRVCEGRGGCQGESWSDLSYVHQFLGTGCAWCWSQVLRTQDALGMHGPRQPGVLCQPLLVPLSWMPSELGLGAGQWALPRLGGGGRTVLPGQVASQSETIKQGLDQDRNRSTPRSGKLEKCIWGLVKMTYPWQRWEGEQGVYGWWDIFLWVLQDIERESLGAEVKRLWDTDESRMILG